VSCRQCGNGLRLRKSGMSRSSRTGGSLIGVAATAAGGDELMAVSSGRGCRGFASNFDPALSLARKSFMSATSSGLTLLAFFLTGFLGGHLLPCFLAVFLGTRTRAFNERSGSDPSKVLFRFS